MRSVKLVMVLALLLSGCSLARAPQEETVTTVEYENPVLGVRLDYPDHWRLAQDEYLFPTYGFTLSDERGALILRVGWVYDASPDQVDDLVARAIEGHPGLDVRRTGVTVAGHAGVMLAPLPGIEPVTCIYLTVDDRVYELWYGADEVGAAGWALLNGLRFEPPRQTLASLGLEPAEGMTPPTPTVTTPTPPPSAADPTRVDPPAGLVYRDAAGIWRVEADGRRVQLSDRPDVTLSPTAMHGDDAGQIGWVALVAGSGDTDIWLFDASAEEERNLTSAAGRRECCPQWWPGRPDVIVLGSWAIDDDLGPSTGYLTVVRTDGSGYRVLDETSQSYALPAPSPDGRTIAYDRGGSAWLYHWETGPEPFDLERYRFPAPSSVRIGSPAWSPDGDYLAWVVGGEFEQGWRIGIGLFDLRAETSRLIRLYEPVGMGGWPGAPVWSPDGRWLAYNLRSADEAVAGGLWVLSAGGETERFIGEHGASIWSPDGRHLVYGTGDAFWLVETGTWDKTPIDLAPGATVVGWVRAES